MFPGAAEADARGMPRHILSTIRRAADRGTTVVEYTLIGGLIALASVSAMQYMNDVANQGMETTLADLETGAPVENAGGGGGGGGATTTTAGGGGGGGTPTTVAPTTSTTAAPTTSTTARSTTPPAWSDTSSQWESWRQNEWEASTRVTVYDNAGLPLPSGSEVRVRITIMDRRVVDALRTLRERNRFMKGLFAWVGFRQCEVHYERPERGAGASKFNYWRLWNFALDGITGYSTVPLRIAGYLGTLTAVAAMVYGLYLVVRTLVFGVDVPGYASTMVAVLLLGGVQLTVLGVIGEYLGRIFEETKHRPLYIVESALGFEPDCDAE